MFGLENSLPSINVVFIDCDTDMDELVRFRFFFALVLTSSFLVNDGFCERNEWDTFSLLVVVLLVLLERLEPTSLRLPFSSFFFK